MKKNDTINFVFLILCVLLLGFVYLNNRMPSTSFQTKHKGVHEQGSGFSHSYK